MKICYDRSAGNVYPHIVRCVIRRNRKRDIEREGDKLNKRQKDTSIKYYCNKSDIV